MNPETGIQSAAGSRPMATSAPCSPKEGNEGENQERLGALRLDVTAVQIGGLEQEPAGEGEDDGTERQERDQVEGEQQAVVQGRGEQGQAYRRKDAMEKELAVGDQQDQESPEDDHVVETKRLCRHPPLAEGEQERLPEPAAEAVEPVLRLAEGDQGKTPVTTPGEKNHGDD